ncbi:MAG: hypothetical protein ACJZ57_10200 [Candidatus Poriferisodalaceae bacterium]
MSEPEFRMIGVSRIKRIAGREYDVVQGHSRGCAFDGPVTNQKVATQGPINGRAGGI